MISFNLIDGLTLVGYLIAVMSIGFLSAGKRDKNMQEYFLAGRSIGWITVGISIFATNISSEHFVGLAGSGAARGLAVGQIELMAIFTLIVLGWVLAPIYMKSGVLTTPEFLEQRFDGRIRKYFAGFSIVMYFLTKTTVTIFAGGMLFEKLFGLNIYTSAVIIVLLTGLYTVIGGANAVAKTHLLQGILLILGALVLTIFSMHEAGGLQGIRKNLPAEFFNMFKPISDPDYPWTGIIFGAPILAFWYWCTDQYIVQRLLGAKSVYDARRGSLLAALLKTLPIFILVLPGLLAVSLFPDINGDDAYATLLISNVVPHGLKGLVVTGLLAAVMSSLASVFNSSAALFTNDFYKVKYPDASDDKLVLVGRLSTTIVVILAILCVALVKLISSQVYLFLQNVQGFLSPPIVAIFLFGILSKKINSKGAFWTFIIGEFFGAIRLITQVLANMGVKSKFISFVTGINFLHFAIMLFVISVGLLYGLSYLMKEKVQKEENITYFYSDTISELKLTFNDVKSLGGTKSNLLFSFVIVLIIVGLWGIWN